MIIIIVHHYHHNHRHHHRSIKGEIRGVHCGACVGHLGGGAHLRSRAEQFLQRYLLIANACAGWLVLVWCLCDIGGVGTGVVLCGAGVVCLH